MMVPPPHSDLDVRRALGKVLVAMLQEVPHAALLECAWANIEVLHKVLHIVVMRVLERENAASRSEI
jgi:hypothetical protein